MHEEIVLREIYKASGGSTESSVPIQLVLQGKMPFGFGLGDLGLIIKKLSAQGLVKIQGKNPLGSVKLTNLGKSRVEASL
jgi:uncharacterized protein (AIM24 family)